MEILARIGAALLGIVFSLYAKYAFARKEQPFSWSKCYEENGRAIFMSTLGSILAIVTVFAIPEVAENLRVLTGIDIIPKESTLGAYFTFGFLLYATFRNIYKSGS